MDYGAARRNMIESQLRPNRVTDQAVLDALAAVPREIFVPEALRGVAYVDEDIPLGGGRFLMEPLTLARLLQMAAIRPADGMLIVGAGPGYSAAVAGRLARRVIALESDQALATRASGLLKVLGVGNVNVVEGSLGAGVPALAPYDVILFDGSVATIPPAVSDQLAEGGRLVAVVNGAAIGRTVLMVRAAGALMRRSEFDAAVPPLPGFEAAPTFVF
jgi:protein-L-isoaspartate(D-aspartate) O-methyltransferase